MTTRQPKRPPLLIAVLREPGRVASLDAAQWDRLIREARVSHLPGRLAQLIDEAGLMASVPDGPRQHLQSAQRLVLQQRATVGREIGQIARALAGADVVADGGDAVDGFALLKGAAYVAAGLPLAGGRLFGDVDILVPKARLAAVESALLVGGWRSDKLDAYDQRYYRDWMHELPPMSHSLRGTAIDVHHTLLPPTARVRLNTPALFGRWRPVAAAEPGQRAAVYVLPPTDMLLHSASHLFHEGEFGHALRDLVDLDALLRHFAASDPGFWQALLPRADALGLRRPLFYALRYCRLLLGTPVPEPVRQALQAGAPSRPVIGLMDHCWLQVFQPRPSAEGGHAVAARLALYLRSHWLRMPTGLLLRHLARKAWRRIATELAPAEQPAATG